MSFYDGKIEPLATPTKTLPKQYSPTREEILKVLGAVSEIEYNKMCRGLDEKKKDINELVQKIHILNEQNTKNYNELCEEIKKSNRLEKQLAIATKALKDIQKHTKELSLPSYTGMVCDKALKEIEEVK